MRIALVTDYYLPTLGGVQTAVKALGESLRLTGHEVTVFCPLAEPGDDPGVVGLPVSALFRPDGYPFAWSPRRVTATLRREFAGRRIDVVHTHSEMFAALGAVRAAAELDIPVVHTMHGRIDVYTAQVLPLPRLTVPVLAALHGRQVSHRGVRVTGGADYTRTRHARRMWRLMLAQSRASAHVIVPSAHFARRLRDQGATTPTTVLSNGLEPEVLRRVGTPTPRTPAKGEPLRIVWVGRLSPEKRPEVLVEAARSFPPGVAVDVYGDGISRRGLERAARRAGAPVTLHGAVPQHRVLDAMRDAHLLVSSSIGFDNQPMVILEAIASGLPVLHCDPDLAETIPDGAGFLARTPDAAGLAHEVGELRRHPDRIGRAGLAAVAARSRVAQSAEPVLRVYADAIRRKR